MKTPINKLLAVLSAVFIITACGETDHNDQGHEHASEEVKSQGPDEGDGQVYLSQAQFNALEMEVDTLSRKVLSSGVAANGQLEVPPQNEASVTAVLGANVASINVIEGDDVKKGQVLGYLSHPDLIEMQSEYLEAYNQLQFQEQEYERQKKLYEAEVGSGKAFQRARSEYLATQSLVKSLGSQLRQLGINSSRIQNGNLYERVPIISPIQGSIVAVNVKTGQYVQPQDELFEIVNTHHIHADLMVFEKDIYKVHEGQRIRFTVENLPGQELYARIYSVGKKFEQNPKAVHVHAEIENKTGNLIPGMYIKGQILTDSAKTAALPEGAITRAGDKYFAFVAQKEVEGGKEGWVFKPVEIKVGMESNGWVAVQPLDKIPENALFAMNNAYYLVAEMQKGEGEHSH